jgi:hypothetical protein
MYNRITRQSGGCSILTGLLTVATLSFPSPLPAQAFPDAVKEFAPGANAGHGQGFFPNNVLGPPNGNANSQTPTFAQQDVLALGTGGHIIMEFKTNRIIDGDGPDFIIFENPVQPANNPNHTFADTAVVAVSDDGITWHTFPFDIVSASPVELPKKSNYLGFAGIEPTYSSPTNGISPFDPTVSGGDKFDLADLELPHIRFIRITDSGDARFRPQYDIQNEIVTDWGNQTDPDPTQPDSAIFAGFDLDAVAGLNTEPWSPPSSVAGWYLYD